MSINPTRNSALQTALAFHYQALVAIHDCFTSSDGQSVYIEADGDVSVVGASADSSSQTEVKLYSDLLTDHHENFWNTLNNWLDAHFNHSNYGRLILHTTQAFGKTSQFKDWNEKDADGRLQILEQICSSRNFDKVVDPHALAGVAKLQYQVMSYDKSLVKAVIVKVSLHVEELDFDATKTLLLSYLDGSIPKANQQAYMDGLIGFVYSQANKNSWVITRSSFISKREELTTQYVRKLFTVPKLDYREATDEELQKHSGAVFVKKIHEIDYEQVLPEAIGSWLELRNSLMTELDGSPKYKEVAHSYRNELKFKFEAKHRVACRESGDPLTKSQNLYDNFIYEDPRLVEGFDAPSMVLKNGLIHDLMDDKTLTLCWKVDK